MTPSVHLREALIQEVAICARAAMPHETGGALIGWREGPTVSVAGFLEIASGRPDRSRYKLTVADLNSALSAHFSQVEDPRVGYVGSWHSHPALVGPSSRDKRTFLNTVRANEGPLAFLVVSTNGRVTTFYPTWAGPWAGRYRLLHQDSITRRHESG